MLRSVSKPIWANLGPIDTVTHLTQCSHLLFMWFSLLSRKKPIFLSVLLAETC